LWQLVIPSRKVSTIFAMTGHIAVGRIASRRNYTAETLK
jgi:hypothetical protein